MYQRMIIRPPVPVLAVVAGTPVLASVPPMAGCGRSRAACGAPVPAWVIGPRPASSVEDSGWGHRAQGLGCAAAAAAGALVLWCIDDLQEAEIADVSGCSAGVVNSQLSRGLSRLRGAGRGPGRTGPRLHGGGAPPMNDCENRVRAALQGAAGGAQPPPTVRDLVKRWNWRHHTRVVVAVPPPGPRRPVRAWARVGSASAERQGPADPAARGRPGRAARAKPGGRWPGWVPPLAAPHMPLTERR
jgi:hypothetical protein